MKAIVVHQYGGPEVLKFEEYPDPVAGLGEVLVRVAATSVYPIDYKRRAGLTKDFYPISDQVFAMAADTYAELCVFATPDRKILEFMAEAVRDGKLVLPISRKLPLSKAAEAQAAAEEGGIGKVLLVA
jgi:NADPH:quinone reductase-like Zn-dependent oxidoreductase